MCTCLNVLKRLNFQHAIQNQAVILGPKFLNAIGKSNARNKAFTDSSILFLLVSFRIISPPSQARVNSQCAAVCRCVAPRLCRVVLLWRVSRCSRYHISIICTGHISGNRCFKIGTIKAQENKQIYLFVM